MTALYIESKPNPPPPSLLYNYTACTWINTEHGSPALYHICTIDEYTYCVVYSARVQPFLQHIHTNLLEHTYLPTYKGTIFRATQHDNTLSSNTVRRYDTRL